MGNPAGEANDAVLRLDFRPPFKAGKAVQSRIWPLVGSGINLERAK
jgi:hypothetical protein